MKRDAQSLNALFERISRMRPSQIGLVTSIVEQLERPLDCRNNPASDLISEKVLYEFGDALRIHHCFSAEPFTKDKFEHALERTMKMFGVPANRAPRGNRGHDITIAGDKFSLKTEAAAAIKVNAIHISKFMELGRGQWTDQPSDLIGLRDLFFEHMENYERILTLRKLIDPGSHLYELVEIPKELLLESATGTLIMRSDSRQFPKPGYCTVLTSNGAMKFQLYFDGGTERKLQIKHLDKSFCQVHAVWRFEATPIIQSSVV